MFSYQIYRILRLIRKAGSPLVYRRITSTFDPVTQIQSAAVNHDYAIKGMIMDDEYLFESHTSIAASAIQIIIDSQDLSITPLVGDNFVLNSIQYRVVGLVPGFIGETVAAYEIRGAV